MTDTLAPTLTDARGCPGLQRAEAALEAPAPGTPVSDPQAFVQRAVDGAARLELLVQGARCAGCMGKIERGLRAIAGVSEARLALSTGRLAIAFDPDRVAPRTLVETVQDLGYGAKPFDPAASQQEVDAEGRKLLVCLGVAAFASMNVMMFSVPVWSTMFGADMEVSTRTMFHWLSAMIALPAAAWAGQPFFISAWNALKRRRTNMDVPISLAVILASGLSIYETLHHGEHAYFDAVVMLLMFLLIGRYLDHRLRQKARVAARDLLALQAVTASVIGEDGSRRALALRDVQPGHRLEVLPGDRVPVDGVVRAGASDMDLSLLTGETDPVPVAPGQALRAGALNLSGRLELEATADSGDSFLAEIARLIETGEQSRSRYVRIADRVTKLYVPVVHSAALLTAIGWLLLGAEPRVAILNACAVLIITCPCALALAVPAVQVVATGRLFRAGVLVKSGDALERLAAIDHVVFDKTGVLTSGQPELVNRDAISNEDLAAAALLARASRHPLARVVARAAGPGPAAGNASEVAGAGVEATLEGARARLGRASWAGVVLDGSDGETELWFTRQGREPVRFVFADTLRSDAVAVVNALRQAGLSVEVLSGDRPAAVARTAAALGLEDWRAEQTPRDKATRLQALAASGKTVLMVGDGLNDAPALAHAHVSMAPGIAADASQSAADMVFQGAALSPVLTAHHVALQARARVRENFILSAAYNAIASPIAMLGLVTPMLAAIAMSASSLLVTLNALRLRGATGSEAEKGRQS